MMKSKVLLVSRYTNLHSFYKSFFEGLGFSDVHITDKDKDGLNMLIRELKPVRIFITSNFYSIGTPYMIGLLRKIFPKLNINVASTDEYPCELAAWFIFHGANSYINLLDGIEEFKRGIITSVKCGNYVSPSVKKIIEKLDEKPDCNLNISKRLNEILFMLCNGYTRKRIKEDLQISDYTVTHHIRELMNIFHVHSKEELIKNAFCLDIVNKNYLCFNKDNNVFDTMPDFIKEQIKINRININRGNYDYKN